MDIINHGLTSVSWCLAGVVRGAWGQKRFNARDSKNSCKVWSKEAAVWHRFLSTLDGGTNKIQVDRCSWPKDRGAVTTLIDLQKAFEGVQLIVECQVAGATAVYSVRVILTLGLGDFEGSAAVPMQTYAAILPGSTFGLVLLRLVMQEA